MKKLLFALIIICTSISCVSSQPLPIDTWGGGVTHGKGTPTHIPTLKGATMAFLDTTTQALWVYNKKYSWWLLQSPDELYVRGFTHISFADGQYLAWATIAQGIKTQAGNNVLNGLYVVKFSNNVGNPVSFATVEDIAVGIPTAFVTNGDIWVCRYYRNQLITVTKYDDKTAFWSQSVRDTLTKHTLDIDILKYKFDSLKNKVDTVAQVNINEKNLIYVPYYNYKCTEKAINTTFGSIEAGYDITQFNGYYFSCPPQMVGDTIVAVQVSFCQGSNYDIIIGASRLKQDGVVQNIFFIPDRKVDAGSTSKTLTDVWINQGTHNGVILPNDRIVIYVHQYVRPTGSQAALSEAYGLSATLVVKPKSQ
jgi:hypothetical protein